MSFVFVFLAPQCSQDGDGLISGQELFGTLKQLMGRAYSDAQLEQVVHNTMVEFDKGGSERCSGTRQCTVGNCMKCFAHQKPQAKHVCVKLGIGLKGLLQRQACALQDAT